MVYELLLHYLVPDDQDKSYAYPEDEDHLIPHYLILNIQRLISFCLSVMWLWHRHSIWSSLACLPDDLKEKLAGKVEARDRFQNLHESVHSISSRYALKLFHDDILRSRSEQRQNTGNVDVEILDGDISQCNQLEKFSRELECLLHEYPSIEVRAAVERQTVGWLPLLQRLLFWSNNNSEKYL